MIRNNETGIESIEDLFVQSKRGGYSISYCNPDDREYLPSIEKFSWHSVCTGAGFGRVPTKQALTPVIHAPTGQQQAPMAVVAESQMISNGSLPPVSCVNNLLDRNTSAVQNLF